ncbi:MAG: hypothetical protein ACM3II_18910 [Rhodospirillaceae bacterium]
MESFRIASTSAAGLTPIGRAAARDRGRLTACLERLDVDGAARLVFADPEVSRDGTRVDWYAPGGRNYVPLSLLPAEERAGILARIEQIFAGLRREGTRLQASADPDGEALITALTLPDPIERYVYVTRAAGDPEGWRAVLVCWGYGNEGPSLVGSAPQVMAQPVRRRATPAAPATVLATAPVLVASMVGSGARRWWLLLWLALLVLLLVIAWLMLRACGLGLPRDGLLYHLGPAFCPGTALAATDTDDRRNRELTNLARELQLQLQQRKVECLAEQVPSTRPGSEPQPSPNSSMAERLQREGAKTGELQVSLAWDGPADLDLHVECPDGEKIYFSQRSGCGGTLDVDMNSGPNKSTTPVENVFWPGGSAASGQYKVFVVLYDRHGDQRPSIPFQVRIKNGGSERTVPGSASQPTVVVPVTEFVR